MVLDSRRVEPETPSTKFAAASVDFYLHVSSPEENHPLIAAQWMHRRQTAQRFLRQALVRCSRESLRICDVGFGDGTLLFYALRRTLEELDAAGRADVASALRSAEIITVDVRTPWEERLRHALAELGIKRYRHLEADLADSLPLDDESVDAIICTEVVEHMQVPEHLLREFQRVLRHDGFLILTTPNEPSLLRRLKGLTRRKPRGDEHGARAERELYGEIEVHGHVSCKPTQAWEALLVACGFDIERFGLYRAVGNPSSADPLLDRPLAVAARFLLAGIVSLLPVRVRRYFGATVELLARRH